MADEPIKPEPCAKCYGRGWYPETVEGQPDDEPYPDYNERYCDCPAGDRLRVRDGGRPAKAEKAAGSP